MMIMILMPLSVGFDTLDPVVDPDLGVPSEIAQNRQNSKSQCPKRNCQNLKMFEIFKTCGNCNTATPWEFFLYFSHCFYFSKIYAKSGTVDESNGL